MIGLMWDYQSKSDIISKAFMKSNPTRIRTCDHSNKKLEEKKKEEVPRQGRSPSQFIESIKGKERILSSVPAEKSSYNSKL